MEKQLFDWVELLEAEAEMLGFGTVTTKIPIGDIPIGSKFDSAWIFIEKGMLELHSDVNGESSIRKFSLHYQVGNEIV